MKSHILKLVAIVLLVVGAATQSHATTSLYLNINDKSIKGESIARGREGEVDLLSMNIGVTHSGVTAVISDLGKTLFLPLTILKQVDTATPELFIASATNQLIPKMVLTAARVSEGAEEPYLEITITDVLVSVINVSSSTERPTEDVSLSYKTIVLKYRAQLPNGRFGPWVSKGFNVEKSKPL